MPKITLPGFGRGLYRIGGLLFEDGVAEVDELSHSDREVIEMLGAEVEGDGEAPAATSSDDQPGEPEDADEHVDATPEAPTVDPADEETPKAEEDAPASPEVNGSSFVDPAPTSDAQAAAAPHEIATTSSSTDGTATLDAGSETSGQAADA